MALLTIALDLLTLARAALYRALLHPPGEQGSALPRVGAPSSAEDLGPRVATALATLRESTSLDNLPKALLTAALYHATLGGDPDQARRLLDEAQLIAERGPMPLHLADVHLYRARLFGDRIELARARELIEKHGYWRRREELADAETTSVEWSQPATPTF